MLPTDYLRTFSRSFLLVVTPFASQSALGQNSLIYETFLTLALTYLESLESNFVQREASKLLINWPWIGLSTCFKTLPGLVSIGRTPPSKFMSRLMLTSWQACSSFWSGFVRSYSSKKASRFSFLIDDWAFLNSDYCIGFRFKHSSFTKLRNSYEIRSGSSGPENFCKDFATASASLVGLPNGRILNDVFEGALTLDFISVDGFVISGR